MLGECLQQRVRVPDMETESALDKVLSPTLVYKLRNRAVRRRSTAQTRPDQISPERRNVIEIVMNL